MPVILKDIARALNVSVITVSKVMRDQPDVAAETRKRVLAKAQELGYRPNLTARSLVTGKSSQVGVIVPTLLHPFFAEVLEGLSSAMKQAGYAVMISSSMEDPAVEEAAIEQLLGHRMDGLIVASCSFSPTKFKQLREQGIPFVLIDRFFPGFRTDFVGRRRSRRRSNCDGASDRDGMQAHCPHSRASHSQPASAVSKATGSRWKSTA
jgi:LacI family transcriptional regulator